MVVFFSFFIPQGIFSTYFIKPSVSFLDWKCPSFFSFHHDLHIPINQMYFSLPVYFLSSVFVISVFEYQMQTCK